MQIKDIENLAEISKIELTQPEKEGLLEDLDGILAYVRQISDLKVADSEVEYVNKNNLREDLPREEGAGEETFSRDLLLKQFPDREPASPSGGGVFLKVKKIL